MYSIIVFYALAAASANGALTRGRSIFNEINVVNSSFISRLFFGAAVQAQGYHFYSVKFTLYMF